MWNENYIERFHTTAKNTWLNIELICDIQIWSASSIVGLFIMSPTFNLLSVGNNNNLTSCLFSLSRGSNPILGPSENQK